MTADERRARTDAADATCSAAFVRAFGGLPAHDRAQVPSGVALVAVGGYGRRELAPHSDLDVVLVHTETADLGGAATDLWYPLWDAGVHLDHAVRSLPEIAVAAREDVRVAVGLLDARHLAGDTAVTLQLRTSVLAQWRREARDRVPELRELVERRVRRAGELAHAAIPDLKESVGGLRDVTTLTALVATWLVDVPHTELERTRRQLLDVRDALHGITGRATDRVTPELWAELATATGLPDASAAQRQVRELGRRVTHISRLTWRRLEGALAPSRPRGARRAGPALEALGHGLAVAGGELVLTRDADVSGAPTLLLRAAAEAAGRDLVLPPPTAARLVRECPALPDPWPPAARDLLVRLLGSGPALLPVWETLDETGALTRFLPEWEQVRLLPHASEVHRFTVDRHLVETCIEASRQLRRVARPDLLLLAALLHDIGKGGPYDHSISGAPLAAAVARRTGLPEEDVETVATLVRRHLLLAAVATTRDLDDPATPRHVAALLGHDRETLELLAALTESDARATAAQAWTSWRSGLVGQLVARVRATIVEASEAPGTPPDPGRAGPRVPDLPVPSSLEQGTAVVHVRVEDSDGGGVVTVVGHDRTGLLAAVAGVLAMHRASVRAARAWSRDGYGFSRWDVAAAGLDERVLREQLSAVLEGRLDPAARLHLRVGGDPSPFVAVRPDASTRSTVLEVRVGDHPGVLFLVCRALATVGVAVRSAHVSTLGPQAVDVLYLQEEGAGALLDERAAEAAHSVRRALTAPVTLGV